jgi:hypothetical protein
MAGIAKSHARRAEMLHRKHQQARDFAIELASMESAERDPIRRDDIARRRREVEVQAAHFQKIIAEIEEGA